MNRRLFQSAAGTLALALAGILPLRAQTNHLWPRFSVTGGSYLITTDDTIRLDVANRIGTEVQLHDDLGLADSESLASFGLDWGFARKHSFSFKYYAWNREGSRTIGRVITIRDVAFPVGASLAASLDTTSIEGIYDYWFVRHDSFGLAASLGLVYLELDTSMSGTAVFGSSGVTETRRVEANTDLPVPMIGLAAKGSPWRRLVLYGSARYLPTVNLGDIDGEAASFSLGADLYLIGAFALGASYDGTLYQVDVDRSQWHGAVDLERKGWRGYARFSF